MRHIAPVVVALAAIIPQSAYAWFYAGNPKLGIWVDRPAHDLLAADVTLNLVRVHKCGGGYDTYTVNQTLDLVTHYSITINGGNLCGVSLDWTSSMLVEKQGAWVVEYDESVTSIELTEADSDYSVLSPVDVVSGTFSGAFPRAYVDID